MKAPGIRTAIAGAFLLGLLHPTQAEAGGQRFEVTVTNLTRGQTFTPILVASHQKGVRLFALGQPASEPLEIVAEAGDTAPLAAALDSMPEVLDVTVANGVLPPGQSATLFVETRGHFDHLSVVAMLIPTNDGFFPVNGVEGPTGNKILRILSPAYDAGTEANDEQCAHIPGPPTICSGEGFNLSRDGAEGYVHIHGGIHGGASLQPSAADWRNPVAEITIRRIQ